MASKNQPDATTTSISSSKAKSAITLRLSSLLHGLLFLLLLIVSFYGGIIYQQDQSRASHANTNKNHQFAIGMVVYVNPQSITISQHNGIDRQFTISPKTLVSIGGTPASASQIKPSETVLIKIIKRSTASIILVNATPSG